MSRNVQHGQKRFRVDWKSVAGAALGSIATAAFVIIIFTL